MDAFALLVSTLLQSRNQAHVYHWQAQMEGSYARHIALQAYYEGIVPLVDGLVESYQGRYGILTGLGTYSPIKEDDNYEIYFEALCKFIENTRKQTPSDSYLQNQIDTIIELIESTKYKLKFLQ